MRVNGQALGIALSGAIVATRLPAHLAELGGHVPTAAVRGEALAGAIHDAFAVAAIVCCVGIVTSLIRGSSRPGYPAPAAAAGGPGASSGTVAPAAGSAVDSRRS
jgi:hypothetical protein